MTDNPSVPDNGPENASEKSARSHTEPGPAFAAAETGFSTEQGGRAVEGGALVGADRESLRTGGVGAGRRGAQRWVARTKKGGALRRRPFFVGA